MNNNAIIMTDSTADLSHDFLKEHEIYSIPLYVRFGDSIYKDGIDLTTPELYKKVEETNTLPQTAAPSPGDFYEVFKPLIDDGKDIVYIGIGSSISGTIQSARVAALEFPEGRIFIVDSKNLSSGIALLVLKAKDLRNQGVSAKEIHEKITKLVPNVRSQFAIQTLDYLHKGGRASGLQALMGSMLRIKPIIRVEDGKLGVYKKAFGKMSRALDIMLEDYLALGDNVDLDYVMVTHSLADKHAIYMMDIVKEKLNPKHLIESHAGCVISSHCGEGTIGILYIERD
jgi:DegV family protein with EDD domain